MITDIIKVIPGTRYDVGSMSEIGLITETRPIISVELMIILPNKFPKKIPSA